MTEGRAREVLQEQIDRYGQEYDAEGIEALEMAIKALEQQEQLEAHIKSAYDCGYNCGYADAMNDIAESEKQ